MISEKEIRAENLVIRFSDIDEKLDIVTDSVETSLRDDFGTSYDDYFLRILNKIREVKDIIREARDKLYGPNP